MEIVKLFSTFIHTQVGDYVKLYCVECMEAGVARKLFWAVDENSFKVLTREDNEAEIQSIEE